MDAVRCNIPPASHCSASTRTRGREPGGGRFSGASGPQPTLLASAAVLQSALYRATVSKASLDDSEHETEPFVAVEKAETIAADDRHWRDPGGLPAELLNPPELEEESKKFYKNHGGKAPERERKEALKERRTRASARGAPSTASRTGTARRSDDDGADDGEAAAAAGATPSLNAQRAARRAAVAARERRGLSGRGAAS